MTESWVRKIDPQPIPETEPNRIAHNKAIIYFMNASSGLNRRFR